MPPKSKLGRPIQFIIDIQLLIDKKRAVDGADWPLSIETTGTK